MSATSNIPNAYPPEADEFLQLYRKVEAALSSHSKFLVKNKKKASVDWSAFGNSLGDSFLSDVRQSGQAAELLAEPPRAKHSDQTWQPAKQTKINNIAELFVRGVCQVRHNIEHSGKFLEPEEKRSFELLHGAFWILSEAVTRHADLKHLIK